MAADSLTVIRTGINKLGPELSKMLPAHIEVEKFQRAAITAVQTTKGIEKCTTKSIYAACMRAANDGLVFDGREAALVVFGSTATYMPMVAGVMKKVRQSGELSKITAHVAYEKDEFAYVLGDDERIEHIPFLGADRGKPICAYAIAHLKDGSIARDVMPTDDIDRRRAESRAKNDGPWVKWWDEMACKTVIKRLCKYLPQSTDIETMFEAEAAVLNMKDVTPKSRAKPKDKPVTNGNGQKRPESLQTVVDEAGPDNVPENAQPAEEAPAPAEEAPPVDETGAPITDVDPDTGEIIDANAQAIF